METKLKIISTVIFLTSFLNFCFSQNVGEKYDTLAFSIDENSTFPYICKKKELYKLFGKPIQKSKHLYVTAKDNKRISYKSSHYMWETVYYIRIGKMFFITSINILDGNYNICFNDSFSVNNKTNIDEIAILFPNSYQNSIVYPKEFSGYYPEKLIDDLIYVIIVIPDGYLDLFFYKNNIYYINFRFNDIDNMLKNETIINCEEYNYMSANCISDFYNDNDSKHLDTALLYIDEALLSCTKYEKLLSLRKLSILSIKQDFEQALVFIEKLDKGLFNELPYFRNLLRNRFLAMKYQSVNNIESRNSKLKICIDDIERFLLLNQFKVDSLLQLQEIDSILSSPLSTAITQYYYYKSILDGKEKVENEILEKQNGVNGNVDYFDYLVICLEEDFMVFIGI